MPGGYLLVQDYVEGNASSVTSLFGPQLQLHLVMAQGALGLHSPRDQLSRQTVPETLQKQCQYVRGSVVKSSHMNGWRTSPLRLYHQVQLAVVVTFVGPYLAYRTQLPLFGVSQTQALFFWISESQQ